MSITRKRSVTFEVVDDNLVYRVLFQGVQRPLVRPCRRATFEQIARLIEQVGDAGLTISWLMRHELLPFREIRTALAFLRKCGIVERGDVPEPPAYPRYYAKPGAYLQAMEAYSALVDGN